MADRDDDVTEPRDRLAQAVGGGAGSEALVGLRVEAGRLRDRGRRLARPQQRAGDDRLRLLLRQACGELARGVAARRRQPAELVGRAGSRLRMADEEEAHGLRLLATV